ncbi:hypothetical protein QGM61_06465 [Pseudohongiella sp. SYSU M77423]|uniref:hypothetical protein n=1 Tax=Pseudohongiella sp. SYSU M77423 TaxID=3042312 RepID=UPI00247FEC07|nr:hypothetical protein [Pseudohongiella sp. SYSU M77423]MDH7943458.1 hypothetical protein [Pseudohongiella sp. SYSU M77423]
MNQKDKQEFTETFLDIYLSHGLGSLPKSEIDLLVFYLLTQTSEYKNKSNYELSSLFKVPESRIKSLRLSSALKYEEINSKAVLSRIVLRFIQSEQFAEYEDGKMELSLEDPIEKRELENFLKCRGHHAEYALNSEVLRISPVRLFELIIENLENPKSEFNSIIRASIQDADIAEELTGQALTLGQKFARFRKHAISASTIRTLIEAAANAL